MDLESKFKATQLWNDVLRTFRKENPVKRHRRALKTYEDTFTASEALDWLHRFLQQMPEYADNGVSRLQALALLNKFYAQGIFEPAREEDKRKLCGSVSDENNTIFKFCQISPSKMTHTPLVLKNHRAKVQRHQSLRSFKSPTNSNTESLRFKTPVTPLRYRQLPRSPGVFASPFFPKRDAARADARLAEISELDAPLDAPLEENNNSETEKASDIAAKRTKLKKRRSQSVPTSRPLFSFMSGSKKSRFKNDREKHVSKQKERTDCENLVSSSSQTDCEPVVSKTTYKTPLSTHQQWNKQQCGPCAASTSETHADSRTSVLTRSSKDSEKPVFRYTAGYSQETSVQLSLGEFLTAEKMEEDAEGLPEMHLVAREITQDEIDNVWKNVIIGRLENLLKIDDFPTFWPEIQELSGKNAAWNSQNVTEKGYTVVSKKDKLPDDLMRAMKILTRWPLENAKYLQGQSSHDLDQAMLARIPLLIDEKRKTPVLTAQLTRLLVEVLHRCSRLDDTSSKKSTEPTPTSSLNSNSAYRTAVEGSEGGFLISPPLASSSVGTLDKIVNEINVYASDGERVLVETCEPVPDSLRGEITYATEFSEGEPVTRLLVPKGYERSSSAPLTCQSQLSLARSQSSQSTSSYASTLGPLPSAEYSEDLPTSNEPYDQVDVTDICQKLKNLPGLNISPKLLNRMKQCVYLGQPLHSVQGFEHLFRDSFNALPTAARVRASWAPASASGRLSPRMGTQINFKDGRLSPIFVSDATPVTSRTPTDRGAMSVEAKRRTTEAMRLVLLFMSANDRYWLQYLLRFVRLVSENVLLKLDRINATRNRYTALDCVFDRIVGKTTAVPLSKAVQLIAFILDNQQEILFSQPEDVIQRVNDRRQQMEKEKVVLAREKAENLRFCDRISSREFDSQKFSGSQGYLDQLLEAIINNENMKPKEKKHKLTAFKQQYPAIYEKRLPHPQAAEALTQVMPSSSKTKSAVRSKLRLFR